MINVNDFNVMKNEYIPAIYMQNAYLFDSTSFIYNNYVILSDFINLTQVHNFTVSAQDIFTFRRLSVFTVSFTGILQLLMQIIKRFLPSN